MPTYNNNISNHNKNSLLIMAKLKTTEHNSEQGASPKRGGRSNWWKGFPKTKKGNTSQHPKTAKHRHTPTFTYFYV